VFTYAAFLSGIASINKNIENLHKKSDIYNAEAKLDRAKAELRDAKAELRDAEAKLDRAKSELRDAKAELDRSEDEGEKRTIRVTITEFDLVVKKARTSFDDLSKEFDRESDVDPHDEESGISSKAKLLGDIANARSKLPNQGYTPPQPPQLEIV
jgi:multidrug resistance efflux pump